MYRPEPFLDGEHFVSATPERMPEVVRHYLRHDDERQRIARAGRDFVTTRLRLEASVERVRAAVGRREAA
jgi:spore maturation protein CgeB